MKINKMYLIPILLILVVVVSGCTTTYKFENEHGKCECSGIPTVSESYCESICIPVIVDNLTDAEITIDIKQDPVISFVNTVLWVATIWGLFLFGYYKIWNQGAKRK